MKKPKPAHRGACRWEWLTLVSIQGPPKRKLVTVTLRCRRCGKRVTEV